ncbi:hypothetical protein, partial [Flavobacterium psychrophilum]|uniref:hypothetical protein n=1 Tax=Flavobacterium psychrophilum TaxID=96345 RepID=UPI001C0E9175
GTHFKLQFEPVRKRFSSVKISKVRGKIFTIVVTRVDSALNDNVPALGEVANFGTVYFLSKIKFLARNKRVFTTKFAILPNACWWQYLLVAINV